MKKNIGFSCSVFLLIMIVVLITSNFSLNEIHAAKDSVKATAIGYEETTIIEFENIGETDVESFRMWLGSDFTFNSFKTESGWMGEKTSQGVIIFTSSDPLKPGEIVKFGIKTDKPKPGINWKALDIDDKVVETAKTTNIGELEKIVDKTEKGVLEESAFRLIPQKPSVGSDIRVVGDGFGPEQQLELFLQGKKLESFSSDNKGDFIITTEIPSKTDEGRVDFEIKDNQDNQVSLSLRIGESEDRMSSIEEIPLSMKSTPPTVYRGEEVKIEGTADPGNTITITIENPSNNVISSIAIPVDVNGNWNYTGVISPDAELGTRTLIVTDGKNSVLRNYEVESSKMIQLFSTKSFYDPGEKIQFSGTASPNIDLIIIVEDPVGTEVFTDVIDVDHNGEITFEFDSEYNFEEGTYVVLATQNEDTEIFVFGLGEEPEVKLIVRMDSLNYAGGSKAIINFQAPPSVTVSFIIIDPSDQEEFQDSIVLNPDGTAQYELDLTGYASGVYTIVATRGAVQTEEVFSVGLLTGSGPIEVLTTKDTYQQGEPILVLGNSGPNILLTIILMDPDGNEVKIKQTFTNKEGFFSEGSIRLPNDAKPGLWTINAKSGPNFDGTIISVIANIENTISISYDSVEPTIQGNLVKFKGFGARSNAAVNITIESSDGEVVETQDVRSTGEGDFIVSWIVPNELPSGKFTIIADDSLITGSSTFEFK